MEHGEERSKMEEKKPELPPVKEFLELYYGRKLEDPTPEERTHIQKLIKESIPKKPD